MPRIGCTGGVRAEHSADYSWVRPSALMSEKEARVVRMGLRSCTAMHCSISRSQRIVSEQSVAAAHALF